MILNRKVSPNETGDRKADRLSAGLNVLDLNEGV
jgi:hypothetical protein